MCEGCLSIMELMGTGGLAFMELILAVSHTKFGWIWSNGLGGDSVTDRQRGLQ